MTSRRSSHVLQCATESKNSRRRADLKGGHHIPYSRRQIAQLFATIAASLAVAAAADENTNLPSRVYQFDRLPQHPANGNITRPVLQGKTHAGDTLEVHETTLAPGNMPHAAHRHVHEEMFLIREGTVEVSIEGKPSRLGPGGVAFVHANDFHGIRNVGDQPAQYFVIALGSDK